MTVDPWPDYPDFIKRFHAWRRDYLKFVKAVAAQQIISLPRPELMADESGRPPISLFEACQIEVDLKKVHNLTDLGIWPLTRWKLVAKCSSHGVQDLVIETTEQVPDGSYLRCFECLNNRNVTKWLPLIEVRKLEEGDE